MGLDIYVIPLEKEITVEELKNDTNLVVEEKNDMIIISLTDNPKSSIGLYSKDEVTVTYARVWNESLSIIRYIAETYDALIGADGFFSDAGYSFMMEQRYCDNDEEIEALAVGYFTLEMLGYSEEYGWSYEFKMKLENEFKKVRETYNKVVERIKDIITSNKKIYFEEQGHKAEPTEDGLPF